jgi:hypothetical protein
VKREAVAQAQDRLERAMMALDRLAHAEKPDLAEKAWSDFLISVAGIYTKLSIGSKGHTKSEAWWGRKIHERRIDPLLLYLHHARNADEHSINPVSEYETQIGFSGTGKVKTCADTQTTTVTLDSPSLHIVGISLCLAAVKERNGNVIPPPGSHFDLEEQFTPIRAAGVATVYFLAVICEARALIA